MFSRFVICDLRVFSMPYMSGWHASHVLVYTLLASHGSHVCLTASLARMLCVLSLTVSVVVVVAVFLF